MGTTKNRCSADESRGHKSLRNANDLSGARTHAIIVRVSPRARPNYRIGKLDFRRGRLSGKHRVRFVRAMTLYRRPASLTAALLF